jgi:hypothetical protein
MLVPEAAMNKYHFPAARKNDIGFSRKIFAMQAEPVTEAVNQAAECNLWIRVFAGDTPHVGASVFCRKLICHCLSPARPPSRAEGRKYP